MVYIPPLSIVVEQVAGTQVVGVKYMVLPKDKALFQRAHDFIQKLKSEGSISPDIAL